MNYAVIKKCDVANGPGVRYPCTSAAAPITARTALTRRLGTSNTANPLGPEAVKEIMEDLEPGYIRGFSCWVGTFEPANQAVLVGLLRHIRERFPEKTIWCYSGYLYETELLAGKVGDPEITREMLGYLDILVDGEFVDAEKDLNLRFKGSRNQRIINVPESLKTGKIVLWEGADYA